MSSAPYLMRLGAAVIGFPVAILLHELGHFFAFYVLGFKGIVLRYASVEWSGGQEFWHLMQLGAITSAASSAQRWHVAAAIAAGPVVTYLSVVACVILTRLLGPSALLLAVAIAAPLRSLSFLPVLGRKMLGGDAHATLDETRLAALTNISETWFFAFAVAFLAFAWLWLVRTIPSNQRRQCLMPVLGGVVLGVPLWLLWLGPWLLP